MAIIMTMNSKQFLKEFAHKFNYKQFQIILVSENIRTKGKYKEAMPLNSLMPSTITLSTLINGRDEDTYKKKYFTQLTHPQNDALLAIIVKNAVINDVRTILMCTPEEEEFGYMKLIKQYLEEVYKIKVYPYKKWRKDPENLDSVVKENKTKKILKKKLATIKKEYIPDSSRDDQNKIKKKLMDMDKSELKDYAKDRGIGVASQSSKKDIVKSILRFIFR